MPKYQITTADGKKYVVTTADSSQPQIPVPASNKPQLTAAGMTPGGEAAVSGAGNFLGMTPLAQLIASPFIKSTPEYQAAQQAAAAQHQAAQNIPAATQQRLQAQGTNLNQGMPTDQSLNRDVALGGFSNGQIAGSALSTGLLLGGGALAKAISPAFGPAGAAITKAVTGAGHDVLGPILGRATSAGLTMAPIGAAQAGATSAAQGSSPQDIAKNTAIGAVLSGVTPFAFEGGKIVAKGAGRIADAVLGIGTGQGVGVNEEIARRAYQGDMGKVSQYRGGMLPVKDITFEAKDALGIVKNARDKAYQTEMAALEQANVGKNLDITPVKNYLDEEIVRDANGVVSQAKPAGIELKGGVITPTEAQPKKITFENSKFSDSGRSVIQDIHDKVNNWSDMSVNGIDQLKQYLSGIANSQKQDSNVQAFAGRVRDKVSDFLKNSPTVSGFTDAAGNVKTYKDIQRSYGSLDKAITEAKTALGLGTQKNLGGINVNTAFSRIMNAFKPNKTPQIEALRALSQLSGVDLTGMVAGAVSHPIIPQGGVGRAALGLMGSQIIGPSAFAPLFMSPRGVSRGAIMAGQLAKQLNNVASNPQAQSALSQLLGTTVGNVNK